MDREVCRDRPLLQATFKGDPWCLEKENVTSIFKEGQGGRSIELRPVNPTPDSGKIMGKILLETTTK